MSADNRCLFLCHPYAAAAQCRMAFTSDGESVFVSREGDIQIFDIEGNHRDILTQPQYQRRTSDLVVTSDGQHAFCASYDHMVFVFDIEQLRLSNMVKELVTYEIPRIQEKLKFFKEMRQDERTMLEISPFGPFFGMLFTELTKMQGALHGNDGNCDESQEARLSNYKLQLQRMINAEETRLRLVYAHVQLAPNKITMLKIMTQMERYEDETPMQEVVETPSQQNETTRLQKIIMQMQQIKHRITTRDQRSWSKYLQHNSRVHGLAITSDDQYVITGTSDPENAVYVWHINDSSLIRKLHGHTSVVNSVAVSPDSLHIVSGSLDKTVRVWRLNDGALQHTIEHPECVHSVAVTLDSRRIVSGCIDPVLRLFDLASGQLVHRFMGHCDDITDVAVSPNGRYVASRSVSRLMVGTLRVWSLDDFGVLPLVFVDHEVDQVAFHPDSNQIATISAIESCIRIRTLTRAATDTTST